jgi:hypothetical protein
MSLLEKLLEKLGMYHWWDAFRNEDHLPCYINRATVTNDFKTYSHIRKYIEACKEQKEGMIGMLLFSVTERDAHHKKWLHVAKKDGYQVVQSPSIHGDYQCWSIFVPNDKLGEMYYR